MKLRTLLTFILLISGLALSAQSWIDVTDIYLSNPRFDGNTDKGWEYYNNGGSKNTGYDAIEFYNCTFDLWQTMQAPAGKYRLSVQAYFRAADNNEAYYEYQQGTETVTAQLYGGQSSQPLASIYSAWETRYVSRDFWSPDRTVYFPNGMSSGAHMFANGHYLNQLEFTHDGGELRVGVKNDGWRNGIWTMIDNFQLEYYGTDVKVTSVSFPSAALTLGVGETTQLTAAVSPSNALDQRLQWSSSNAQVATVDSKGLVTALSAGTAAITAAALDGSGKKAVCTVTVVKNEPTAESLIINELQAANVDMFVDPSFNYGSWVELYNPTAKSVHLQGLYVSDDASNLKQHRLTHLAGTLPAKGYKVLWFDHYSKYAPMQIDSKLDYDGGAIYISNEQGEVLAFASYPEAISRTSYARQTDGTGTWAITSTPTPGRSNNRSVFTDTRLDPPVVSRESGLFTSGFSFRVEIPAGTTLRYTTDGTAPTESNGKVSTSGTFNVSGTATYRFRLFKSGHIPSRVVTRSFIHNDRGYYLPVVSVVTDPDNLYDDSLGIYVKGVNGRTGNGQSSPCNWNMDWDRPVNFEYFTADGTMAINQEANMEMCGGWSRAWTPHSFKIKANKIYEGENYLPYQIFPKKAYLKHKTLQIRNGGNDTDCRIKDAALQTIVHTSGIDMDGQECQPVHHFINGEYKGMLNIREPNNKHFVEANYALDDDEIDQFEMSPDSNYAQKCGTDESFLLWYNLSSNAADAATYESIRQMVDIDEYINYMATEFYLGGTDWPQNNIKGYKPRREGGKFRFVLFDLDGAFSASSNVFSTFEHKQYNHTFDLIYDTGERMTGEIKMVTIFFNMLQNEQFRKQFIDTYCLVAGSVFEPQRCAAIIDSMAASVEQALSFDGKSPWGTAGNLKWNLSADRQQTMINALKSFHRMQLSGTAEQKVKLSSNLPQARLLVNGLPVPTGKFDGSLFGPVTLRAEAPAGYRFAGWVNTLGGEQTVFDKGSAWHYYDQGSLDGESWQGGTLGGWQQGNAPLGYYTGDSNNGRGYQTFLDYGSDASNKRPTYYFHKTFTLHSDVTASDVFTLHYTVDDGMVVYVNGKEAARYLMNDGTPTYDTFASSYANGNPDSGTLQLPASLFRKGANVISVEVHNNNAGSSDIYFDAALTATVTGGTSYLSTDAEFDMPSDATLQLEARFEQLPDAEMAAAHAVPVRINEISADNGIYVNATYFKKNDWIELYNTTSQAVDVAGMYLTDKLDKPHKYQIPSIQGINTVIPAHGYLVIWADKLEPVSQLHTQFKLDDEGGCVMLTSADEAWTDTLFYPQHADNVTVGLYPDGGTDVYVMNLPTIGASNRISSYAEFFLESELPSGIQQTVKPEGASLYAACHNGVLTVMGDESARVVLSLYAATGQRVLTASAVLTGGQATIPVGGISSGIYIIHLRDNRGNSISQKLLIR